MKRSLALLAASLGLALAHGDSGGRHVPRILGGRDFLSDLEARGRWVPRGNAVAGRRRGLERRQNENRCGPEFGSCAEGECCSAAGWCGKGPDYCKAPDCQLNYGPGCDGNQRPSGPDTSGVARPKVGNVPYGGAGVYSCVNPGEIALTFDDGPYIYTNDLLDMLKSYDAKATFFVTGNNIGKGQINDPSTIYPDIIKRMHAEGHQIGSHTWSHQDASQLTDEQFTAQMVWNEIALNSILGFFPTYMRPPYSICGSSCQDILSDLGYHIIYFDLDTAGYLNTKPEQIQASKDIWDDAVEGSDPATDSFLQIEHDIHEQVVYNLTDYILESLSSLGYRAVTVGECLGDPSENWYRAGPKGSGTTTTTTTTTTSSSSSTTRPVIPTRTTISVEPTGTGGPSTDGTCGNGVTCADSGYGPCCSFYGWCGDTDDHCSPEKGCQAEWGDCGDGDGGGAAAAAPSRSAASSCKPPSFGHWLLLLSALFIDTFLFLLPLS